ncbi:hypothetical protein [uncultured Jannaschia sp.]|uniref:hypothetical protein n=1 Tax=uncultured Jannaschia sp. TaxID=293347 RepID=UPI0026042F5D|nr:hypothetical protein [uncultured Jannaschia sp.]
MTLLVSFRAVTAIAVEDQNQSACPPTTLLNQDKISSATGAEIRKATHDAPGVEGKGTDPPAVAIVLKLADETLWHPSALRNVAKPRQELRQSRPASAATRENPSAADGADRTALTSLALA